MMGKKLGRVMLSAAMALSLGLTGCGGAKETVNDTTAGEAVTNPPADSKDKTAESQDAAKANIAVVFSTLGDLNFNDWGYQGIELAEKELGITFDYVECPTVPEAETQIDMFASSEEYDLVIVLGSDRKDIIEAIAEEYPEQKFALIDSAVEDGIPNLVGIRANYPEWGFLSGVIAGLVTQDDRMPLANSDNIIGFAGGMDSPVSRAGAAGFLAGAKYVNPEVEIIYTIVGSYTDPTKGKEIAMTTYDRGADVMSVNCGSSATGVFNAAQEKNKYFVSTSLGLVAPENSLCTSITRFDLFVYQAVEMVVNDSFTPGTITLGIKDGACDASFEGTNVKIPDDILAVVNEVKQQIVDGKITFPNDPDELDEWVKTNHYEKK